MATSVGGCCQTLIPHQAGAFLGIQAPPPKRPSSAAGLDASAHQLRTTLLFLSLPLASAAHAFTTCCGWKELGYARLSDHARERLGRSARWVRDLAALSEAVERLPGLASALTGEDGGQPIGVVAACHIGKVASPESLAVWLSIARSESVRILKARVRCATRTGSHWPEAEPNSSTSELPAEDDSHQRFCLLVPAAVREAFAETLDLYRAVEGHTTDGGEFVDSLMAEACSGSLAGEVDLEVTNGGAGQAQQRETTMLERLGHDNTHRLQESDTAVRKGGPEPETKNTAGQRWETAPGRWSSRKTPADTQEQEAIYQTRARRWLQEILGDDLKGRDAVAADARLRRLIYLHDEIERQLAEVVTQMADAGAWRSLGYGGFDDYARRGLGWSRSTLHNRVQLVRRLRRLPVVQQAYRQGRIGRVAAQAIARVLTREATAGTVLLRIPEAIQKAWVERAAVATAKRLQDEIRAVARLLVVGRDGREPLDDLTWHASLHRQAGTTRRRVQALTHMAMTAPGPLLPLRLTLRRKTASDLARVLEVARRDPALARSFSMREPIRVVAHGIEQPVPGRVETFSNLQSTHGQTAANESARNSVPAWVALLVLLQEFIETWDNDVSGRRPSSQRIYIRDGWRCMAPGCSSRRNLEVHHVVYRSQGGDDQPENLLCLCRFHHQMGEHGLLARVRGEAPLGLTWRLGRDGRGGRFRNELRLNG